MPRFSETTKKQECYRGFLALKESMSFVKLWLSFWETMIIQAKRGNKNSLIYLQRS